MKRITKLFATLALTCFAGAASAQDDTWVELPVQGWVHEWVNEDGEVIQIDDEKLPDEEGVYTVHVRSAEEAYADGNAVTTDDNPLKEDYSNFATWDSQFFVTVGEENAMEEDDIFRLTMEVMATTTVSVGSQAHANPGNYNHWACAGNVSFTANEWTEFDSGEVTVTSQMIAGKSFYTIAFNLAEVKAGEGYTCYFKNIKVERYHPAPVIIEEWTDLLADLNGDLSGDDMRCFYSKEYPSADVLYSKIVDGAIVVNSPAKVSDDWDSQFWIRLPQALPAGTKYKVKFDYMASASTTVNTQMHAEPGDYIHYVGIGDVNFTTSWDTYEYEGKVTADQSKDDHLMHSIAFNLSKAEDMVYYFRNFSFEIPTEDVTEFDFPDPPTPAEEIVWQDIMLNGDMEGDDARCFYTKNAGGSGQPVISTIEEGIGANGSRGIRVTSLDREVNGVDDNGNDTYEGQDWDAQFFIRLPQAVPAGTPIKVTFDYMADNDGSVDTQSHNEPGQYIHWACAGSPDFTTEWKTWEYVGKVADECDGSEADGGYLKDFHTIAFNLSKNKIATNFYFDNIKIEIPEDAVTDPDFPEVTTVPFTVGESGWTTFSCKDYDVDFDYDTDAYTALYEDGFVHLFITTELPAGEGVIINMPAGAGEYTANIIDVAGDYDYDFNELRVSDGSITGDLQTIYVLADGAKGVGFYLLKEGEFVPEGKAYLKIEDAAAREFVGFAGTTGINTVATADKAENVIYNIAGQRVVKAQKGLYIMNGKKVIK